jgi:RNA polymerase sigma-70 factor (ECF subfamily)
VIVQDTILVRDFQNGSDLAFVNLYNRYKQPVYVYCLKVLSDADAAKDVVQGVFLKVYERRAQLSHPERFKSWLLAIARNDCLTHLRKAGRTSELPEDGGDRMSSPFVDGLEKDEEVALVSQAIAGLNPQLKEVIILREYENLSYREIAEVIGAEESTVKSRLFTARQALYEKLKPVFEERK